MTADLFTKISGDAAELANNDPRIPQMPWFGTVFTNSHLSDRFAIDYNRNDITYAWLTAKGKAIRQHKTRPYGIDRSIRTLDDLFKTLDTIAYDSIADAIALNLHKQTSDAPLLTYVLEQLKTI